MIGFDISHLHPMLVHFPIALLLVGFLTDLLSAFYKKETALPRFSFYLLALGTASLVVAWLSGALFTPSLTGDAAELRETHEHFGLAALFFAIVALVLRIRLMRRSDPSPMWRNVAMVAYAASAALVAITGALGGTLVYGYLMK